MAINWVYSYFNELSPQALYSIMRLRSEVFVVEQNCVYLDADGKDEQSWHLCGWDNNTLVAYCRIIPPGLAFAEASIGRVVSAPAYRRTGAGRALMHIAIEKTLQQFKVSTITIGAQLYLAQFYGSLGFVQTSDVYMEDGIPHIEMQYKLEN
ncbi:MAG TPA: GNAT family N-acetyltransferase [Ferruginibacter sp.]|nr:GNAT family N-acetyltransferase [Ferruginibacter sp.]HMP22253.1 GNAT family N-acetyltransferase [Ferruginibacter sp.]